MTADFHSYIEAMAVVYRLSFKFSNLYGHGAFYYVNNRTTVRKALTRRMNKRIKMKAANYASFNPQNVGSCRGQYNNNGDRLFTLYAGVSHREIFFRTFRPHGTMSELTNGIRSNFTTVVQLENTRTRHFSSSPGNLATLLPGSNFFR